MTITVSVLGSGSRGNATFIKTACVRLLIDAGMSRKEIARRLESIGEDPDGIDAIFITHEHNDHAAGVKTLLKELPARAFMTFGTGRSLQIEDFVEVKPGVTLTLGDLDITPFRVPHDAADPVAFTMECRGVKITQLTDTGYMPDDVAGCLRGSNMLILESNHDLEMLRVGPYPWNLKQRLMGRYGHLSNTAVGKFLRDQFDGEAEHVVLAHLSSKNNHPEVARREAYRALCDRGLASTRLEVTSQDEAMPPIQL